MEIVRLELRGQLVFCLLSIGGVVFYNILMHPTEMNIRNYFYSLLDENQDGREHVLTVTGEVL